VSYGRINPDEAADIFIQNALVEGELKNPFGFLKHNQQMMADISDVEDRLRRRDLLVDETKIFGFYKDKLNGIYDTRTLASFLKKKGSDQFLRLKKEDLLAYNPDIAELDLYPDQLELGNHVFDCSYCFDPGSDPDGVTVKVPSGVAPLVPADALDWLVPGLYNEKIAALIRGLPKNYRRKLVPVNDTVDVVVREMPKVQNSLVSALGEFIFKRFGIDIPASAWSDDILPDHLKMRIAITGPDGRELKSGRSKDILQQQETTGSPAGEFEAIRQKWEKTGITRWDFDDLPDFISNTGTENANWVAYPALVKSGTDAKHVALRLFQQRDEALRTHKLGVAALFGIRFAKDFKFLKRQLFLSNRVALALSHLGGAKQFEKKMFNRTVHFLFAKNIRTKADFEAYAKATALHILSKGRELAAAILPVLTAFQTTQAAIHQLQATNRANPILAKFLQSLSDEVAQLVPESFLELYDLDRLAHIERYLKAIAIRAQRALVDFEKDQTKSREVIKFRESLDALLKGLSPSASEEKRKAIEDYFWLIEEYKVSVYAQELKTALPVSKKRLQEKLKAIERMR
jgi:ATP-dependent helicase HrpA